MIVDENDIELLHGYIDGELPVAECEGLWRRLAAEPQLAGELEQIRADKTLRQSAWSAMEPDDKTVAALEASVLRAARRSDVLSTLNRGLGLITSVAACILFGFTIGWLGREKFLASPAQPQTTPGTTVALVSPRGGQAAGRTAVRSVVDVLDGNGNIIARQPFDSSDEAQQFARDIQQLQAARQQGRESNIVPASLERF